MSTSGLGERSTDSSALIDAMATVDEASGLISAEDGAMRRTLRAVRRHISTRHSLVVEIVLMAALYALYDSMRGLALGGANTAFRNARTVAELERHLHIFVEPRIQAVLTSVPGLVSVFNVGYATFHLGVTGAVLIWLYFARPHVFPRIRTLLVITSMLALVGFVLFPAAPPRLAGLGIKDTLHLGKATAESGVLHWLYNPYAAVPSLHMAFAVIAGGSLMLFARRRWVRVVGFVYPLFVAAEVIATGNHFLFDVLSGIAAVGVAAIAAIPLAGQGADRSLRRTTHLVAARTTDMVGRPQ
jgi:hypothetical protein